MLSLQILEREPHVALQAGLRGLAARNAHIQEVVRCHVPIVPPLAELVWPSLERVVEDLPGHLDEIRMSDPRAVEAIVRFARLVFSDFRERDLVRRRISAARDKRGHAADRMGPAAVARLYEELRVGAH